ncbi:hypothetical protein K7432_000561 [Basidiobolus ranarum]
MVHKSKKALITKANNIVELPKGPIYQHKDGNTRLELLVKPGAKQNQIIEFGERIGVQISAPPRDGEANKGVVNFVAEVLKVRKSDVTLVSGLKCREKVVSIEGVDSDTVKKLIRQNL